MPKAYRIFVAMPALPRLKPTPGTLTLRVINSNRLLSSITTDCLHALSPSPLEENQGLPLCVLLISRYMYRFTDRGLLA